MRQEEKDPQIYPDPLVGEGLRLLQGEPPLDQVDWVGLRSAIGERAALPLARRRSRQERRHPWRVSLIPLAVAASIGLAVWVGTEVRDPSGATVAEGVAGEPRQTVTAEEVFGADVSEQEFRLLVSGRADPDGLLALAVEGS